MDGLFPCKLLSKNVANSNSVAWFVAASEGISLLLGTRFDVRATSSFDCAYARPSSAKKEFVSLVSTPR